MATLTIQEAAQQLGISEITIRRRLRGGQLSGYQEDPPNGRWWVDIPDEELSQEAEAASYPASATDGNGLRELVDVLKEEVASMRRQLDVREREVRELHVIIQHQAVALPQPKGSRPWWKRLVPTRNGG